MSLSIWGKKLFKQKVEKAANSKLIGKNIFILNYTEDRTTLST